MIAEIKVIELFCIVVDIFRGYVEIKGTRPLIILSLRRWMLWCILLYFLRLCINFRALTHSMCYYEMYVIGI